MHNDYDEYFAQYGDGIGGPEDYEGNAIMPDCIRYALLERNRPVYDQLHIMLPRPMNLNTTQQYVEREFGREGWILRTATMYPQREE